jgi:hypothetical protein
MKKIMSNPFFIFVIAMIFYTFILPMLENSFELVDVVSQVISLLGVIGLVVMTARFTLTALFKKPFLMFKLVFGYIYGIFGILNIYLQTPEKSNYYLFSSTVGAISLAFAFYIIHAIKKAEDSISKSTKDGSSKKSTSDYLLYLKPDAKKSSVAIYFFSGWTILILNYLGVTIDRFMMSLQESNGELYALLALWSLALVFLLMWYLTRKVEVSVSNKKHVKLNFLRPRPCRFEFNLKELSEVRVGVHGPDKYKNSQALEIFNKLEIKKAQDLASLKSLAVKASGHQKIELSKLTFITQDLDEYTVYLDDENIKYLKELLALFPEKVELTTRMITV